MTSSAIFSRLMADLFMMDRANNKKKNKRELTKQEDKSSEKLNKLLPNSRFLLVSLYFTENK